MSKITENELHEICSRLQEDVGLIDAEMKALGEKMQQNEEIRAKKITLIESFKNLGYGNKNAGHGGIELDVIRKEAFKGRY